jgi:hypothetical protein
MVANENKGFESVKVADVQIEVGSGCCESAHITSKTFGEALADVSEFFMDAPANKRKMRVSLTHAKIIELLNQAKSFSVKGDTLEIDTEEYNIVVFLGESSHAGKREE